MISPPGEIDQVHLERRRVHRHQHVGRVAGGLDRCGAEVDLEGRDAEGRALRARISAGKSGKVARSLPASAVERVNCPPVSCMPSPLSPAKRTTIALNPAAELLRPGGRHNGETLQGWSMRSVRLRTPT
jgi:hypothetical protein